MKSVVAVFVCLALLCCLCACVENSGESEQTDITAQPCTEESIQENTDTDEINTEESTDTSAVTSSNGIVDLPKIDF